jgi:hypothetical protein
MKKKIECLIVSDFTFGGTFAECHQQLDTLQKKYEVTHSNMSIIWGGGWDDRWLELRGYRWETAEEESKRIALEDAKKNKEANRKEKSLKKELQNKEDRKKLYEELSKEFNQKL